MAYLGSLYGQCTFNNHLDIHYPYHCPLETYFTSFVLRLRWPTNGESQLFIPKIHFEPHNHINKKPLKYKWDEFSGGIILLYYGHGSSFHSYWNHFLFFLTPHFNSKAPTSFFTKLIVLIQDLITPLPLNIRVDHFGLLSFTFQNPLHLKMNP